MDNLKSWETFQSTGKVEDYLKYADEKRLRDACERFISALDSEGTDGRNNHSGGDGYILNGYK